ncbi:hypothetical protein Q9L58_010316 [Maublancomyces gigas]|uniref:Trypsin-like peptidase domain-containing protein n=1 Tax=Discina gigas TaxID=1032678 RepID=A0ABR3G4X2_9PEZI
MSFGFKCVRPLWVGTGRSPLVARRGLCRVAPGLRPPFWQRVAFLLQMWGASLLQRRYARLISMIQHKMLFNGQDRPQGDTGPAFFQQEAALIDASFNVRGAMSCGTGFFYMFPLPEDPESGIPVIITNKHVMEGAKELKLHLKLIQTGTPIQEDGTAEDEVDFSFEIENPLFAMHPDPNIDLCALNIAGLIEQLAEHDAVMKATYVSPKMHLDLPELKLVRVIEPVVMVGYPNGLWDEKNNRPITRRGQTASHALLNWNGRREFMIDAACFGGSSGSPVFIYEDGMVRSSADGISPGTRAKFIGVLWGGPVLNAEGRMEIREVPTALQEVPITTHMLNLGFVVHASAVNDLFPVLLAEAGSTPVRYEVVSDRRAPE